MTTPKTCPRCDVGDYGRNRRPDGVKHRATVPQPPDAYLERAAMFDGECEATDGCIVEPDGSCEHGHSSWLKALGVI
jgi:hypothetical protein